MNLASTFSVSVTTGVEPGRPAACRAAAGLHYRRMRLHGGALQGGQPGIAFRFFQDVVLPWADDACLLWPYRVMVSAMARLRLMAEPITFIVWSVGTFKDPHRPLNMRRATSVAAKLAVIHGMFCRKRMPRILPV
jgi:hypothetical protein